MGETQRSSSGDIFTPPVVVRPPTRGARPYRRVEIYGRTVGKAFDAADVAEFIRRAGVEDPDLTDPELVGWRGGDQTVWSAPNTPTAPVHDVSALPETSEAPGTPATPDGPHRPDGPHPDPHATGTHPTGTHPTGDLGTADISTADPEDDSADDDSAAAS